MRYNGYNHRLCSLSKNNRKALHHHKGNLYADCRKLYQDTMTWTVGQNEKTWRNIMDTKQLGNNIAKFRKKRGMTQDNLAELLSVSPQAVSKWENDVSYPDIEMLPKLATIFGVSMDTLFSNPVTPETEFVEPEKRKDPNKMLFKIRVKSHQGDTVSVNIPIALLKVLDFNSFVNNGNSTDDNTAETDDGKDSSGDKKNVFQINGINLGAIDWDQLLELIDNGVIGKLVEVNSADGDLVEIYVE
jgi:transcriptional regulator with XRE-family HTH domain